MRRSLKSVTEVVDRMSWVSAMLSGLALLVVVVFVVYGVLLRYVFRSPASWAIELPSYMFLAITALGLAYVQRHRGHIGVEILTMRLSQKAQSILTVCGFALFSIYAGFSVWAGWLKAWEHMVYNERSLSMGVPLFAVQLIIPIAFSLLCLQSLAELGKELAKLRSHDSGSANVVEKS